MLIADANSSTQPVPRGGIRNLAIQDQDVIPTSGRTAGIFFGGDDPGGLAPRISGPADNYFGQYQTLENVSVLGFNNGIMIGDNAFNETLVNCTIIYNDNAFSQIASPLDSGENNTAISGLIADNNYAFYEAGGWNLSYVSLDFNGGPSYDTYPDIYDTDIYWEGGHLETNAGVFFSTDAGNSLYMKGVGALFHASSGTAATLISQTGASYTGGITLVDDNFFSASPVTNLITSDTGVLRITGLAGNGNRSDGTVGGHPLAGIQSLWNSSYGGVNYSSRLNQVAFRSNSSYTPTKWNYDIEGQQQTQFTNAPQLSNNAGAGGYVLDLFDGTASAATPHKFFNVGSGNLYITNSARTSNIFTLTDTGAHSWGGGAAISSSSAVATTGTPTVGHAACIKAAGPPS